MGCIHLSAISRRITLSVILRVTTALSENVPLLPTTTIPFISLHAPILSNTSYIHLVLCPRIIPSSDISQLNDSSTMSVSASTPASARRTTTPATSGPPVVETASTSPDRPVTSKARGVCKFFVTRRGCKHGNKCKFLHGENERLSPYDKNKTCRYFENGAFSFFAVLMRSFWLFWNELIRPYLVS